MYPLDSDFLIKAIIIHVLRRHSPGTKAAANGVEPTPVIHRVRPGLRFDIADQALPDLSELDVTVFRRPYFDRRGIHSHVVDDLLDRLTELIKLVLGALATQPADVIIPLTACLPNKTEVVDGVPAQA